MRILIVASGTAGGLIGARVIERGCDVTFLVRRARKVQLMTTGLMIASPFGRFHRPVAAITADELAGNFDLVLMATRAQDYRAALKLAEPAIGPDTAVMPVHEGGDHLDWGLIPNAGRPIGAVFEARIGLDADGVLIQRSPAAELQIGAIHGPDAPLADLLTGMLAGRGLVTVANDRIEAAIWDRYCFTAAAAAVNAVTGLSLRDAVRPTHHLTVLDRLLGEGVRIGEALGLRPERARSYRQNFRLDTRPIQGPGLIRLPGRGADEAVYLLARMAEIAERAGVRAPHFLRARHALVRPRELDLPAVETPADLH